jgi:uncharacterized protein (DUF924 family)|tara:strand:+ start:1999 stop:2604 length:606 start_codon:yes stop_codon:yes gene_type:complete
VSLTNDVLSFWFEGIDLTREIEKREVWFKSTPEFDQAIRDNFLAAYEDAAAGNLDEIKDSREGCLALILILDQFSRNLFRHDPKAFAADPKAREFARHAMDKGFDEGLSDYVRVFFYLPFEHSEIFEDQELALQLFLPMDNEKTTEAAIGHHDAIARFGRFPHRNAVLGRENTPEEEEYLKDPPMWGKTAAETEAAELAKG